MNATRRAVRRGPRLRCGLNGAVASRSYRLDACMRCGTDGRTLHAPGRWALSLRPEACSAGPRPAPRPVPPRPAPRARARRARSGPGPSAGCPAWRDAPRSRWRARAPPNLDCGSIRVIRPRAAFADQTGQRRSKSVGSAGPEPEGPGPTPFRVRPALMIGVSTLLRSLYSPYPMGPEQI
jgi:hypothetical protein